MTTAYTLHLHYDLAPTAHASEYDMKVIVIDGVGMYEIDGNGYDEVLEAITGIQWARFDSTRETRRIEELIDAAAECGHTTITIEYQPAIVRHTIVN